MLFESPDDVAALSPHFAPQDVRASHHDGRDGTYENDGCSGFHGDERMSADLIYCECYAPEGCQRRDHFARDPVVYVQAVHDEPVSQCGNNEQTKREFHSSRRRDRVTFLCHARGKRLPLRVPVIHDRQRVADQCQPQQEFPRLLTRRFRSQPGLILTRERVQLLLVRRALRLRLHRPQIECCAAAQRQARDDSESSGFHSESLRGVCQQTTPQARPWWALPHITRQSAMKCHG
jgi:hypothetical protein